MKSASESEKEFLTTEQLARRWKMRTQSLAKRRCLGQAPSWVRLPGISRVLYALDEIERCEREGASPQAKTSPPTPERRRARRRKSSAM